MPATSRDLEIYRKKRSAERTPEPFGRPGRTDGRLFVIQHHAARRLHYDFRLELEGVLLSGAVPKGPSPNPADKRLAVQVEDHPLEYAAFEGRIPEGNYGAGGVIVWDRGAWVPTGDPVEGLEKGKLLFELRGYKLRGRWTLIKTKKSTKDWLLIKERDSYAAEDGTEAFPQDSILSGRIVQEVKEGKDPGKAILAKLKRLKAPARPVSKSAKVMLARSGAPFTRAGWLFEIKFDGYRLLAGREGDKITLYSRAGHDLTTTFPEIADVIQGLAFRQLVMDGEAVVHDEQGRPSFGLLQRRGRLTRRHDIERARVELPATFYAFDLLGLENHDLRDLPLVKRKALLKEILPTVGPIRYSDHVEQQGEALYLQAQHMGLEGIMAKQADSPYRSGRSSQWVKISLDKTDDFVIVGFTDPKGTQPEFGALLLAQYEDDALVYVGRAGTGLTRSLQKELGARLKRTTEAAPPRNAERGADMHWIKPELVCQVRFKNVTADGLLRAPVFVRLRNDKRPEERVRESKAPEPPAAAPDHQAERRAQLTNPEKVFWPDEGITKGDLIEYYRAISKWMLPYLKDRPIVLVRYPDGIKGKSFFQKDAPAFAPEWIRIERLWSEHPEREVRYFVVDDVETLVYVINLGTIPLHIWSSRIASLERPDWCILDLDPKGAPFQDVLKIANAIQELCRSIKLPCFPKTSGATGLHVLIPLGRQYTYEQSRSLGALLARVVVQELPDIATVTRRPTQREGRVYIDYLQNRHGQLLIAPFSVRPLPRAPVSMPLKWSEVRSGLDNGKFTIKNAIRRMRSLKTDPLRPVLELRPDLPAALTLLSKRLARKQKLGAGGTHDLVPTRSRCAGFMKNGTAAKPIGNVYYGTCGWTDRTLIQSGFYPSDVNSAAARLHYYAERFPIVEVDSTYYAPPSQRNAELWAERTPSNFVLNIKAYAALTHHPTEVSRLPEDVRALLPASQADKKRVYLSVIPPRGQEILWNIHDEALRPLAEQGKLGCVLFQFPPWFRKNRQTVAYLEQIPDRLSYPVAVEFRGGGWMDEDRQKSTLDILERHGLSYVVVDEPQGFKSSVPPVVAITAPLAVTRFHGRNAETWEKKGLTPAERFNYRYSEDELKKWTKPLHDVSRQAERVHALFNNCHRDDAVVNARQLGLLLKTT